MSDDRRPDGGESAAELEVERAGGAPPDPPSRDGLDRLLPDLLGDVEEASPAYLVRAALAGGDPRSTAERLVTALEAKVAVLGSTLEAGFDPSDPAFDVLIESDHDPGAIAASLADAGPVEGVLVADVTDAAERALDGEAAADAADANDVFQELKDQVNQVGYDDVVEELEDVSFPGGPDDDEEVDLEAAAGVELEDDEPEPIDLEDAGPEPIDLEGGEGVDAEDLDMEQLLGGDEEGDEEAGERAEEPIREADEETVSEAIESVDLEPEPDDAAEDAASPEGAAEESEGAGESGEPEAAEPGPEPAEGAAAAAGAAGIGSADMDAFVGALVEALESGAVGEQRRTELREALGIESTHSLDVRLEYLQKRVDNLAAYTDAWEAFLSEEGSGRDFIEGVREDLAALEERLDDVEAGGGVAAADVEALEGRLEDLEEGLAALEESHDDDVARLDTRMDSVESKLEERLDGLDEAVGTLTERVEALLSWRERLHERLGGDLPD